MISEAAAITIQKIADSNTAIVITGMLFIVYQKKTTLTTVVFYKPLF